MHHNLFMGRNSQHVLQFINGSTRNDVRNNLFVGVAISGAAVTANGSTVLMEVDASAGDNFYAGNYYIAGHIEGRTPTAEETARSDLDPAWFTRLPVAPPASASEFRPTAAAPWLDLGARLDTTTVDIEGATRGAPVDIGPFELP